MKKKIIGNKFIKNLILIEIIVIIIVIFIGAFLFYHIEGLGIIDSIYFIITTMSTIGFGDIVPKTDVGKIIISVYAVIGVPLFVSLSGLILESRLNNYIKFHVAKFHKELQKAENDVENLENHISREIKNVIKETEKTGDKIEKTASECETTKRKVDEIEKVIEISIKEKKSRRKIRKKK